VYSFV